VVLDNRGETLDPVAGIEIVHIADDFVCWGMNVSADDAIAFALMGEFLQLLFVAIDEGNRGLDFAFDGLADGEILLAAEGTPFVINTIEGEQRVITECSEHGEPAVIGGHAIKAITVNDEVFFPIQGGVYVLLDDADRAEGEW